jgi:4-carboxymuconolactone decarboxylase
MPEPEQSRTRQLLSDFAPKIVSLTEDVLLGDIRERAELSPRDRSLTTLAAPIATGSTKHRPATSPEHTRTA